MTPHRLGGQSDSFNADRFPVRPSFIFVIFQEPRTKLGFKCVSFVSASCVRRAKQIFHLIFVLLF